MVGTGREHCLFLGLIASGESRTQENAEVQLRLEVHYDFTHRELTGESEVFELPEGAQLGELLHAIDTKIIRAGKEKGIDTAYKTTLAGDQLNGCTVFINGAAPEKMLEHELHDGDRVDFVYGFCGG